jgi:hypothetical protein
MSDEPSVIFVQLGGHDCGPDDCIQWTASSEEIKVSSVVYGGRIFMPNADGHMIDVTDAAPGPDGVLCAYGCDTWSVSSECPRHRNR